MTVNTRRPVYVANTHTGTPVIVVFNQHVDIPLAELSDEEILNLLSGFGMLVNSIGAHLTGRLHQKEAK